MFFKNSSNVLNVLVIKLFLIIVHVLRWSSGYSGGDPVQDVKDLNPDATK